MTIQEKKKKKKEAVGAHIRYTAPGGCDHPFREVAHWHVLFSCQVEPNFLPSLSDCSSLVICILWISLASWKRHMPGPAIPGPRRSFDEQHFRITVLYPFLGEEVLQLLNNRDRLV